MSAATSTPFTLPLPDGWATEQVVEDTIVADGLALSRAGIAAAGPTAEEMIGSAAECSLDGRGAIERARFELLERIATIEAINRAGPLPTRTLDGDAVGIVAREDAFPQSCEPARWRHARSNGVALHTDWTSAAQHALGELVERDRILRSWYGEVAPAALQVDWTKVPLGQVRSYDWHAIELPAPRHGVGAELHVVSVFGFPRTSGRPLVFGHGARPGVTAAFDVAAREAQQVLAFLWDETIPTDTPPLDPTAGYHLDYWQLPERHELLRRWLAGDHVRYARTQLRPATLRSSMDPALVTFADLTSPWLRSRGFCVAKALSSDVVPLTFGDGPFGGHLPHELRIHPVA